MTEISSVSLLRDIDRQPGERGIVAAKLLHLYEFARSRPGGIFLELGTDRGQATKIILEACENYGGRLVSVDVIDCSSVSNSENWQFVCCSSIDKEYILNSAHYLKEGIDLIYVDSKHTPDHVRSEINTWMPYLKIGGRMYFDDIDPGPYQKGARKDSVFMEISNREIFKVLISYFRKNIESLRMNVMYGSTGLACLEKFSDLPADHALLKGEGYSDRRFALPYRILKRLNLYRPYRHKRDGSDFLLK